VNVKQVSEMLGHASIAITLDLYAPATERTQDQALAAIQHLLWQPANPIVVTAGELTRIRGKSPAVHA
jgi:hypothetical protein